MRSCDAVLAGATADKSASHPAEATAYRSAAKIPYRIWSSDGPRPPTNGIPDAWHLIIFRALAGQNARKCFCKNGTYVNLGLSKKVKKPFKTVKKP